MTFKICVEPKGVIKGGYASYSFDDEGRLHYEYNLTYNLAKWFSRNKHLKKKGVKMISKAAVLSSSYDQVGERYSVGPVSSEVLSVGKNSEGDKNSVVLFESKEDGIVITARLTLKYRNPKIEKATVKFSYLGMSFSVEVKAC